MGGGRGNRRGRQSAGAALIGKTVELQTEDTLFKGVVMHLDPTGDVYTLKNALDVTNYLKIPGQCVISGVKLKRVVPEERQKKEAVRRSVSVHSSTTKNNVSEHEESSPESLPNAATSNNCAALGEPCPEGTSLVVPDDVGQKSSALFRNLRGRKLNPDEQPAHLSKLRTRLPPTGICELIKQRGLGPDPKLEKSNTEQEKSATGVFSCGTTVENRGTVTPDLGLQECGDSQDQARSGANKAGGKSVMYVSNQLELALACECLSRENVIGFCLQGDLRNSPARVSLICFSTPQTCILVDFVSCGASYGIMRDCFQEMLESNSVLKVCLECGIVAEVLRVNFKIKLTNVFDPQVVDGVLAAGFDANSVVPDQYYGLRTLLRYYLPNVIDTFPQYCFKSESDYNGWLKRPLPRSYVKVAEAEVRHLTEMHKVQQDRINAKCALIINSRLHQFTAKGSFPVCVPCKVKPEMLIDQREIAKKFPTTCGNNGRNVPIGLNMPVFSKNINHHPHRIDLSLGSSSQ